MLSETPPHHWPLPVIGLLRLLPLRGGYSSHSRCGERLELLDTHHTFTLDSHGLPDRRIVLHAPSTSLANDRLRRHVSHQSLGGLFLAYHSSSARHVVSPDDLRAGCFSLVVRRDMLSCPSGSSVASNLRRGVILAAGGFAEVMTQWIALPEVISLADGFAEMAIRDHHSGWLCRVIVRGCAV